MINARFRSAIPRSNTVLRIAVMYFTLTLLTRLILCRLSCICPMRLMPSRAIKTSRANTTKKPRPSLVPVFMLV